MKKRVIDLHSEKAKQMFNLNCKVEDVAVLYPEYRKIAKQANYVELYSLLNLRKF